MLGVRDKNIIAKKLHYVGNEAFGIVVNQFCVRLFFCFEMIYYVTNIQCKSYLIGISSQSKGTPAALTKKNQSE